MPAAGQVPGASPVGPGDGRAAVAVPPGDSANLIAGLQRGEEAAFEALVRLHGPRMLSVARRYLPQEADAYDALQDAFVSVARAIRAFNGASRLETWLHRVVVNAALMQIRSRSRRREVLVDDETLAGLQRPDRPASGAASVDAVEQAEFERIVHDELSRLPDGHRVVLTLRDLDGCTIPEIASLLDVNVATAKMRLQHARRRLRLAIQRRVGFEEDS